ncbi:MAG: phospholipid carrier-dependent glycosyltransferase [Candidatus Xenobia bacterium]
MLLVIGFGLRAWCLSWPFMMVFDEHHYVPAALAYLQGDKDPNFMHPPLGKLAIAASMETWWGVQRGLLHDWRADLITPLAWRLGSLLAGLAIIVLTWRLGTSMFGRSGGFLAGFLLAIDFLHIVHSRLATLDIYEALFILIGLYYTWEYIQDEGRPSGPLWKACIAYGLGIATKWSTIFAVVAGLLGIWLLKPGTRGRDVARISLQGLVVSLLIYSASYVPLLVHFRGNLPATAREITVAYRTMWQFRHSPAFNQTIMSKWWEWPILARPVLYVQMESAQPDPLFHWVQPLMGWRAYGKPWVCAVVGIGSFWTWGFCLLFVLLAMLRAVVALRERPPEEWEREKAVIFCLLSYLAQVCLWAVNIGFLYYMLPVTPFMALLTAEGVDGWRTLPGGRAMVALFLTGAIIALIIYWPVLVGFPIPEPWMRHILFYCDGIPWWGLMR